jgi:centrosomal protein CEP104
MPRLRFKVISCSSEDPNYPSDSLNDHGPNSKGWQSSRFCEYPQELVLEFLEKNVCIQQLQLLSHQSKIASTIEILTANGEEYELTKFQQLGHLSMDNNERSGHRAQELKSVFIDANNVRWLKLKFHKCYINRYNLYNQIGIIAINALGEQSNLNDSIGQKFDNNMRPLIPNNPAHRMNEKLNDLAFDIAFDKATADKIRSINTAKAECVKREDFQAAKALKNVENQMKAIGVQLAKMESQKKTACDREDYDTARTLRDEIRRLREGVDNRLEAIPAYKQFVNGGDDNDSKTFSSKNNDQPEFGGVPDVVQLGNGDAGELVSEQNGATKFM